MSPSRQSSGPLLADRDLVVALRDAFAAAIGMRLEEDRLLDIESWLADRVGADRLARQAYVAAVQREGEHSKELPAIAARLTIGETYFFRNAAHVTAWREEAIPLLAARVRQHGRARVLSLGSASGEELYTIAILLQEMAPLEAEAVSLVGIDVDPEAIAAAKRARYAAWSLRSTPASAVQRWFRPNGRFFDLDPSIVARARFETGNLAGSTLPFLPPQSADLILCRNVLMYFERGLATAIAQRAVDALTAGGLLFLGHAESFNGLTGLEIVQRYATFYGCRTDSRRDASARLGHVDKDSRVLSSLVGWTTDTPAIAAGSAVRSTAIRVADDRPGSTSDGWVERVEEACAAIDEVTERLQPKAAAERASARVKERASASVPISVATTAATVAAIEADLAAQRFDQALRGLQRAPAQLRATLSLQEAIALTQLGRLPEARILIERRLSTDGMNPEVWYQLALCEQATGALVAARQAAARALYLDPGFAMPQLLLGQTLTSLGDRPGAERAYRQAAALLPNEPEARLARLGGGFSREALIALCRNGAAALEGRS